MFYQTTPFKVSPPLMVQGTPQYLFGSFPTDVAPTFGYVLSDSASGTTGTVTVKITQGNVPLAGSQITISGASNNANFNVTNATILSVSAPTNPDMGVYTITFTISSTTQGTISDGGIFTIPQPEVGDILTSAIVAALPVSSAPVVSPVAGPNSVGKSLSATVTLPANTAAIPNSLASVTVLLQGANFDLDAQYNTIATIATAIGAGTTVDWQSGQGNTSTGTLAAGSVTLLNFRFYRMQISTGATGTGPIVAKLLQ